MEAEEKRWSQFESDGADDVHRPYRVGMEPPCYIPHEINMMGHIRLEI